ncbi:hypothetical protein RB653_004128 [Dictyostelium firmibasis]|uniref:AP-3 complex subunit delta n=1 Tax=Dictyostelium firmibasis TaxID=79012 RepID=A0AAN7UIQ7_9MYCE
MFERTLVDLIRGIRNHKKNETRFINQCINEIKEELKGDMQKKTVAVQKLTYIQMLGFDISWASFKIVEVMSCNKFSSKRIGYLAASQSFNEGTDVIVLATHQIRKDFLSSNQNEAYLALNCLSNICTPDLARELANDILTLLSTQKTHILKRAITVLYKIFLRYPESLRPAFPKLREKLDDPEPSVVSCSVNVICELARRNPKNYLPLAPVLFRILTNTTNNYWMLIKIVKLFASLTPHEPRLGKKLIDPLTNIINSSPSVSLLYECIQTCITGMSDHIPLMKLCISKLRTLIEHNDQNLKYLGLLALNNIMKIHPKAVSEHRDLVLNCLEDDDTSIRLRALDLLPGMTSKKNIGDIVLKLLDHLDTAEGQYKDQIIEKIIELCSMGTYQFITDFEWYINILVKLSQIQESVHGKLIASQLLDVVIRVKIVRAYSTRQMIELLKNPKLMSNPTEGGMCEVLYAAAWIVGEFSGYINRPIDALEAFLQPRVSVLPSHIQSVYMLNSLKVFSHACAKANGDEIPSLQDDDEEEDDEEDDDENEITHEIVQECLEIIKSRLTIFTHSIYLNVQERACLINELLSFYSVTQEQGNNISKELISLFTEQLNPVGPKAQKKVPVPEGLDLDEWINDPKHQEPIEEDEEDDIFNTNTGSGHKKHQRGGYDDEDDEDETNSSHSGHSGNHFNRHPIDIKRQKEERLRRQANNPYMLGGKVSKKSNDSENIPVVQLTGDLGHLHVGATSSSNRPMPSKGGKKIKKHYTIDTTIEMPEGAKESDDEDERDSKYKNDALSNINLSEPLTASDVLHTSRHRTDIIREKEKEMAMLAKKNAKLSPKSPPSSANYSEVTSPEIAPTKKASKKAASTTGSVPPPTAKKPSKKPAAATSTAKPPAQAAPAPAVVAVVKKVTKTILDDDNFKITCELLKVSPNEVDNGQVKLTMKVQNKTDEDMSDVSIGLKSSPQQCVSIKSSGEIGVLEADASTTHTEVLNVLDVLNQELQFTLVATPSSSPSITNQLSIILPFSFFIVPTKLPKDKFAEILQKSGQVSAMDSTKINGQSLTMPLIIEKLSQQLSIEVVQAHPNGQTASFYAKTTQNHHIAMLVKEKDGNISFDIKSPQSLLNQILVKEIAQLTFLSKK